MEQSHAGLESYFAVPKTSSALTNESAVTNFTARFGGKTGDSRFLNRLVFTVESRRERVPRKSSSTSKTHSASFVLFQVPSHGGKAAKEDAKRDDDAHLPLLVPSSFFPAAGIMFKIMFYALTIFLHSRASRNVAARVSPTSDCTCNPSRVFFCSRLFNLAPSFSAKGKRFLCLPALPTPASALLLSILAAS